MTHQADDLTDLAQAWDEAADGYEKYFVPRFKPWLAAAVDAAYEAGLPPGAVHVPCCGTFPESHELVARFGDREICGVDISSGMVRLAKHRTAHYPNVTVVKCDASMVDPARIGECAAVVSVFGLQQLSEPEQALRRWLTLLRPGGRLSVMFWPVDADNDGPFALLSRVLSPHLPDIDDSWERGLKAVVASTGAELEIDDSVSFPMSHPDPDTFFDADTRHGRLRALRNAKGHAFMEQRRAEFLKLAPKGELTHYPRARHLVARMP